MEHPQIIEVRKRSEQGVTQPFLCRCDNGFWYWVKGKGAGRSALCAEWVAGRIAQTLELPIPDFSLLRVPDFLVHDSLMDGISDLGTGLVFGSQDVPNCRELVFGDIPRIPQELRARILFLDWLVGNDDRRLCETGGNPNLLWCLDTGTVRVIDHNCAFDEPTDTLALLRQHVFAADWRWLQEHAEGELKPRLSAAMVRMERFLDELPETWTHLDPELTQPTGFAAKARQQLQEKAANWQSVWGVQP